MDPCLALYHHKPFLCNKLNSCNKIVGNLGPDAIAAAVTGQRVTFILQAVLTGVLAGSTALIARNWGANDRLEAGVFFTRTVQLVIFLSLISSMLVWQFAEPLVIFFGLKDQALSLSIQYLKAISPFYIAFGCGMALITALRAVGDVKTPLIIGLIMNLFAIFFMLVFVNGWLGFPRYGVVGAAFGNGRIFCNWRIFIESCLGFQINCLFDIFLYLV
jgi:Na+-driven multidrug efflux pump